MDGFTLQGGDFLICVSLCVCGNNYGIKWAVSCSFWIAWRMEGDGLNQHRHSFCETCSAAAHSPVITRSLPWWQNEPHSCSTVRLFVFCLHPHFLREILAMRKAFLLVLKEAAKPHRGWLHSLGRRRIQWEKETPVGHIGSAWSPSAPSPSPIFQKYQNTFHFE